jgi:hypothetical protein
LKKNVKNCKISLVFDSLNIISEIKNSPKSDYLPFRKRKVKKYLILILLSIYCLPCLLEAQNYPSNLFPIILVDTSNMGSSFVGDTKEFDTQSQAEKSALQEENGNTLGKINELIVNVTDSQNYVDLDTGNLFFYPADMNSDSKTSDVWEEKNSIDIYFLRFSTVHYGPSEIVYLISRNMIIAPVSPDKWNCTHKELMLEVKRAEWEPIIYPAEPNIKSNLANSSGTGPCPTFVFRTQEGNAGILQVQRILQGSRNNYQAKIRYWLLRNPTIGIEDEQIMWGNTVDGIVCAVKPVKNNFTNGEIFEFDIIYKNVSDHSITVCIYRDYFFTWTRLKIIDSTGMEVMPQGVIDGLRPQLKVSDFVNLEPGQLASVREVLDSSFRDGKNYPLPGIYGLKVSINEINKMRKQIIGFDEFCTKNNIKPWIGTYELVKSGISTLVITQMPEIEWGQQWDSSQIGIRNVDLNDVSVKVPVFLRNNGSDDKKYFGSANFEIILNDKTYLSYQWPALNAGGFTIYSGQTKGPIWLDLGDYVNESSREKSYQAERPLKKLSKGQYNLKVIYVGRNGTSRISAPEIKFIIPEDSMTQVKTQDSNAPIKR